MDGWLSRPGRLRSAGVVHLHWADGVEVDLNQTRLALGERSLDNRGVVLDRSHAVGPDPETTRQSTEVRPSQIHADDSLSGAVLGSLDVAKDPVATVHEDQDHDRETLLGDGQARSPRAGTRRRRRGGPREALRGDGGADGVGQAEPDREAVRHDRGPGSPYRQQAVAPRVGGDGRVLHDHGAGIEAAGQRVEKPDLRPSLRPAAVPGPSARGGDALGPAGPGENRLRAEGVELLQQGEDRQLRIAHDRRLHGVVPTRGGWVDVELHKSCRGAASSSFPCSALESAYPIATQQIGLAAQGPDVGVPGQVAYAQGIVLGNNSPPVRARQQSRSEAAHQEPHLLGRARGDDAAAGPHDGLAGGGDDLGRAGHLGTVGYAPASPQGLLFHRDALRYGRAVLEIDRNLYRNRSSWAGHRLCDSAGHQGSYAVGRLGTMAGLGKTRHHAELVGNFVDVALGLVQVSAVDLARQVQHGRQGCPGLDLASHGVGRSRPGRGQADPEPTRRPREAVGRADGSLLVADSDRANPAVTPDRVVDGEIMDAGDAENDVDSRPRELVHHDLAACSLCHLAPVLMLFGRDHRLAIHPPGSLTLMDDPFRAPDFSFVHAADLHLDTPFKGIGSTAPWVAEQLREASLGAFDSLVELCLERRVAFLVIAGDVYDGPERGLRAQLRFRDGLARLSDAGISSFVVHGNHDPVETGWSALSGPWPERVTVFGTATVGAVPVEVGGTPLATVQGISFAQRSERENLALKFAHRAGPGLQVGVLHCNVHGAAPGYDDYSPCTLDDLRSVGLDYWALGHVHASMVLSGRRGSDEPWVVYPGNLQARSPKPSERGPKGAVVVHVSRGRVTDLEPVSCDVVRFDLVELDIGDVADLAELRTGSSPPRAIGWRPQTGVPWCSAGSWGDRPTCILTSDAREPWRTCSSALRGDFAEDKPFCWWDSVDDLSRPAIDLDSARAGSDFAADLIAVADEARPPPGKRRRRSGGSRVRAFRGASRTRSATGAPSSSSSSPRACHRLELVDRALVLALGELEGDRR